MIDFRKTATLLAHGDGVLAEIAQASRQLLTGVRLGDAGEVGRIAAAVIDGVKILRIEDLQAEAAGGQPAARKGLVGRLIGIAADAHTAFKGFEENRKQLPRPDGRRAGEGAQDQADLAVAIELLDQQAAAIRRSLHGLKIEIAAGQIALDRGQEELEALRQNAVQHRRSGRRRRRAGVPRRARQFPRQDRRDAREPGRLGDADPDHRPEQEGRRNADDEDLQRHARGHPAADGGRLAGGRAGRHPPRRRRSAKSSTKRHGRSRCSPPRARTTRRPRRRAAWAAISAIIDVLAQVADETIKTMHEVIDIEREVAAGDREREAKLTAIRDRLVTGMQGVNRHATAPSVPI